jgi:hypothetical protein
MQRPSPRLLLFFILIAVLYYVVLKLLPPWTLP